MKSISLISLLFAVLVGVALAFVRPAQPVQVAGQVPPFAGLDSPGVIADPLIHPARKSTFL